MASGSNSTRSLTLCDRMHRVLRRREIDHVRNIVVARPTRFTCWLGSRWCFHLFASSARAAAGDGAIRPFHVNIPQDQLVDLRRRVLATRWPERETVTDRSQGVQLAKIQEIVRYWGKDYDWRKVEARLNALPQFMTEIDGLDIHFIHVRSKHENALPLIVTHGWPGSVIEQFGIIDPLTNPTAHGASAADAFDLVIPSMPGYGFSGKPTTTGWDPDHIARAWAAADEAPRLHPLRRPGRRLGRPDLHRDGAPGAGRIAGRPRQLAGDDTARGGRGARRRRAGAGGTFREGDARRSKRSTRSPRRTAPTR